jgi:hypothetical protein
MSSEPSINIVKFADFLKVLERQNEILEKIYVQLVNINRNLEGRL